MTKGKASLDACAAKLDRATEHLDALRTEQSAYMESSPLKVTSHFDAASGWWSFRASCERISLRYSNIVGDCVHNLRSTLDQLVTQLAIVNGQQSTTQHQFPITRDANTFSKQASQRLKGLSDEHRAIIEAAQPYQARDDGSGRPQALVVLNDLSNRDKHRLINAVVLVAGSEQPWSINFGSNADAGPIGEVKMREGDWHRDGEELARVHITPLGPDPEVSIMRDRVPAEILFVDWGLPVIPTLFGTARQVARILDHVEAKFST
jgi:hypothetical protein